MGPDDQNSYAGGEMLGVSATLRRRQPGTASTPEVFDRSEIQDAYGESPEQMLDIDSWSGALDIAESIERVEREVDEAIEQEDAFHREIRDKLFPMIGDPTRPFLPKNAGVFEVTSHDLLHAQTEVLFNGGVEACTGICVTHDTLPLSITQIGVCLVNYMGGQGAWGHRLFRKDLRVRGGDPLAEAIELLHRRNERGVIHRAGRRDQLSELARRGILRYAERAILFKRSSRPWRMGYGHPAPYELLTGSGSMDLLEMSLDLLQRLILDHKRFVFIPSRTVDSMLTSIGYALRPREFAIVERDEFRTRPIVEDGNLRGKHRALAIAFVDNAIAKVVAGVLRTGLHSPPQVFFAHEDYAEQAALIAMADSVLQPARSFPTLIDLASSVVQSLFGGDAFNATVQNAYARRGDPLRYLNERDARF